MSGYEDKSIKIIKFTGEDFKIWSRKFCVRANRKGYLGTHRRNEKIPTLTEYQAANTNPDYANKKQIVKFWKLNELAL